MNRILILLLFFSNSVFAQVNLNQGLVAYYPFSGNANDASGNNNNPVFNNATLTSDRFGNLNSAYSFNGTNNYIRIPNNPTINPANQISICAWVQANGFYQGPCHGNSIIMKGDADFLTGNYLLRFDDGGFTNFQNCSIPVPDINHENFYGVSTPVPNGGYNPFIQTGQWYSVIYTSDGVTSKFYVNCQLKISIPANGITFSNQYDLFLGRLNDPNYPYWFNGVMDEVRIYNRAINQDEVNALGDCIATTPCDNWLSTPSVGSYTTVGDVDVSGNQITVEASFNRTAPANSTGGYGFLVSKHTGPANVNYALWPNGCAITTDVTGERLLSENCPIQLNKTYHVAMVYDGATLKFYRNGYLHSQTPITGNLITNNLLTTIAQASSVGAPEIYQFFGYINEVRIWNTARTQSQIQTYMNSSIPNPTTQAGLVAYYTFDDLLNKQGNAAFNGTLGGGAAINTTNPNCNFVADSCSIPCTTHSDFSFTSNPCTSLSITFQSSAINYNSIEWDFGDGNSASGNPNPTHLYNSFGNYTVKMIVTSTCNDTVSKTITLDISNDAQLITTSDTTICYGSTKQLLTVPALSFCWSPTTYLDNPNNPNPITSTPQSITYYYTAEVTGNNLIVNGDFSAGNTGFTSQYVYANPNLTEGQYFVGTNPQAWNPSLSPCTDHTTGNGNMMLINGAPVPDVNVWKETVTVSPNTNYAFSTWVQGLWPPNPAQLQFSINGTTIGPLITASLPTCTWTQFYTTWNSGNNTSAVISIVNKNTQVQGNDFALDDISFAPTYIKRDSVRILVDSPLVRTNNDTAFCAGGSAQLNATGASSYIWSPAAGLSNPNISNPVASPSITTQYIVTGTNANGCVAKDSVIITINPKPSIAKSNDTTICRNTSAQLFASGGTNYSWSPAATLNNPNIANPIANPVANTTYYVTVTSAINCSNNDSVKINIRPAAVFSISPDVSTCFNIPIQLNASGGDIYSWTPSNYLDNPTINNPHANPPSTTIYSVNIKESTCNDSTTLTTQVSVLPLPTLQVTKQNDIDCSNDASQLNASGAIQYSWSPAGTLSNPNISNPVARPTSSTLYSVQGTDATGCTNTDTISVFVLGINKGGYLMANAFTPNNDGLNDCYGIKYWGIILELDFSIYNRWGERIFHTKTPGQCWDGTYRGILQNPDVYVYMIKAKTTCDDNIFRKGTFALIR